MGAWSLARRAAAILAHDADLNAKATDLFGSPLRVFLDGIGTEWKKENLDRFPYVLLTPAQTQTRDGAATHTVRAVVAVHAGATADTSKSREEDGVRMVGRGEDLEALVGLARDAIRDGLPGSKPEGFTADYDLVNQYPVQSADLTMEFADAFAFDEP